MEWLQNLSRFFYDIFVVLLRLIKYGHQTVFACHTELMPSTESPSLSPEDNTPKGIKKQTGAYQ